MAEKVTPGNCNYAKKSGSNRFAVPRIDPTASMLRYLELLREARSQFIADMQKAQQSLSVLHSYYCDSAFLYKTQSLIEQVQFLSRLVSEDVDRDAMRKMEEERLVIGQAFARLISMPNSTVGQVLESFTKDMSCDQYVQMTRTDFASFLEILHCALDEQGNSNNDDTEGCAKVVHRVLPILKPGSSTVPSLQDAEDSDSSVQSLPMNGQTASAPPSQESRDGNESVIDMFDDNEEPEMEDDSTDEEEQSTGSGTEPQRGDEDEVSSDDTETEVESQEDRMSNYNRQSHQSNNQRVGLPPTTFPPVITISSSSSQASTQDSSATTDYTSVVRARNQQPAGGPTTARGPVTEARKARPSSAISERSEWDVTNGSNSELKPTVEQPRVMITAVKKRHRMVMEGFKDGSQESHASSGDMYFFPTAIRTVPPRPTDLSWSPPMAALPSPAKRPALRQTTLSLMPRREDRSMPLEPGRTQCEDTNAPSGSRTAPWEQPNAASGSGDAKRPTYGPRSERRSERPNDSFDCIPRGDGPNYRHVSEPVRRQAARQQMPAHPCHECYSYYSKLNLTEAEMQQKMASCRHRQRDKDPDTPSHFWQVGFDTLNANDCDMTQAAPSRFRRAVPLKKLFNQTQGKEKQKRRKPSDNSDQEQ